MINKDDYKLSFRFVERTERNTEHINFQIEGPNDTILYFYTYKDMSGFRCRFLNDPSDYILFGTLLLLLKDEIEEEMRQHYKDAVPPYPGNKRKGGERIMEASE